MQHAPVQSPTAPNGVPLAVGIVGLIVVLVPTVIVLAFLQAVYRGAAIFEAQSLTYAAMGVAALVSAALFVVARFVGAGLTSERAQMIATTGWLMTSIYALVVLIVVAPVVNNALDGSAPRSRDVVVLRYSAGRTKRGTSHRAVVRSWRAGEETRELQLTGPTVAGAKIRVVTRDGFLGWEWLDSATVVP